MTTASQTPGPMPPESPPAATPDQTRSVFEAYGVVVPVPVGAMYTAPWPPNGGHASSCAYAGGISRKCTCPDGEPPVAEVPVSVEEAAAAGVLDAVRAQNADATSLDLAAAEARAGILFDAVHVQEVVDAAVAQARTETQAELAELHTQLTLMAGDHRRVQAVLRLCEGRLGDDMLLVSAVAVAAESGTTALDGLPMTLTWTRSAKVPDAHTAHQRVVVECTSSYGGRADLVLTGEERGTLGSLLTTEVRDIHAKCDTPSCGTDHDLDAGDMFGWSRLEIAHHDGPRWYCSDMCVVDALARAGHELAAADDLDARYGAGASDEYALQAAEAHAADVEDERGDVNEAGGDL